MKKIERIEKGQQYELNNETKKMVSEELLKMGFSYSWIGTYYVQDMIVLAMDTPTGQMETVKELKGLLNRTIAERYGISPHRASIAVSCAVEHAFTYGNINYLLDVFKSVYNPDTGTVRGSEFVMTVAERLKMQRYKKQSFDIVHLRLSINRSVEKITDLALLENLRAIIKTLEGGVLA